MGVVMEGPKIEEPLSRGGRQGITALTWTSSRARASCPVGVRREISTEILLK